MSESTLRLVLMEIRELLTMLSSHALEYIAESDAAMFGSSSATSMSRTEVQVCVLFNFGVLYSVLQRSQHTALGSMWRSLLRISATWLTQPSSAHEYLQVTMGLLKLLMATHNSKMQVIVGGGIIFWHCIGICHGSIIRYYNLRSRSTLTQPSTHSRCSTRSNSTRQDSSVCKPVSHSSSS